MDVLGNFRSDIIFAVVLMGYFFCIVCWNKNTLVWCALASSPRFTSALSWDRLPRVQRNWYRRAGVDSSALVPVVMGVAVCQGQCERPLCFSAAASYERDDWRQTWIQPWARSRKQHSPTTLQILIGMYSSARALFKWTLFIFITSN